MLFRPDPIRRGACYGATEYPWARRMTRRPRFSRRRFSLEVDHAVVACDPAHGPFVMKACGGGAKARSHKESITPSLRGSHWPPKPSSNSFAYKVLGAT